MRSEKPNAMAKIIELTQNKQALVSPSDFDWLSQHSWFANCDGRYATRQTRNTHGKSRQRTLYMHREILDAPDNMEVDHINGNGLDNRRQNLRLCTHAENARNQKPRSGASQFKGVSKSDPYWHSAIGHDGDTISLGSYETEKDAARAYDKAAIRFHGEFASLNFEDSRHFDFDSWQLRVDKEARDRQFQKLSKCSPWSSTGFKGVTPTSTGYIAKISNQGTREYLGFSKDPVECARLYDARAIEIFGDEAYLNFPEEVQS